MPVTDRLAATTVQSTFTTLGVKLPKALAVAFDQAETIAAKAPHLGGKPGDLERVVREASLAGREPAADPAVQTALAAQTLAGNRMLDDALTGTAHGSIRDACVAHLDAIVGDWRQHFDTAAGALTAAHQRIGDLPLDDTAPILAKGGDVAEVWAQAQTAQRTIDTVLDGWTNLMRLIHVSLSPDHRALKLAPLTLTQWQTLPAKLTAWDAVRAGLALSVPTLEEYRARVAAIQQAQAEPETVIDSQRSMVAGREVWVPIGR